ncbi:hypothetical protein BDV12DRAFT_178893 [Aspergillus spectabilis]
MQEPIQQIQSALKVPTYPDPSPARNTQPNPILDCIKELKAFITDVQYMTGGEENEKAGRLFSRLASLQVLLHGARSQAEVQQLEREELRQAAEDVRQFARRRNIMLAQPIWQYRGCAAYPNTLFFSSPEQHEKHSVPFHDIVDPR